MMLDRLACLIFAFLVSLPFSARAETDEVPPLPDRKQAHVEGAVLPGDQPTIPWTDAEIAGAKAECETALKGIALDYEALPPIKEGICGAPAPILVKSIGSDPKVAIDPPATMTCPLAAGLFAWLKDKVQPDAKAMLGTEVVKLHNATSYACRNRYGSATTPLSEHALANALDVSDFVFASGEHITVLDGWPRLATVPAPTPPKPSAVASLTGSIMKVSQAATPTSLAVAARDRAIVVTKIKANPFEVPMPPQEAKPPVAKPAAADVHEASAESTVAKSKSNPFVAPAPAQTATAEPSTPEAATPLDAKPANAAPQGEASEPALAERTSAFIKDVHDKACAVFGTTLGPAANEAHKNHFHLDMKAGRRVGFCE
jgi:hypothetical protein